MVDVATDTATELHVPKTPIDQSADEVVFSPDGRSLVWTIRGAGDDGETSQVWLTDDKGEQARLLISETGLIWNTSLSPDGSQIAYRFAAGRQQKASVRLLSVEQQESRLLVPSSDSFNNPAWAPNGLQIAMTQCAAVPMEASIAEQKCHVSVLDLRSERINQIVSLPGRVYREISWSLDGELLAFVSASQRDLETVWLYSSKTGNSYPVSEYVRPFSKYGWLQHGLAGER
jgi:Tol biopolymer transport system component